MSTEKMREEFEAWLSRKYGKHMIAVWDEKSQTYNRLACTIALEAWVESRAAIEVELPTSLQYTGSGSAIDACRDAIESIGVKVKP